MLNEELESFRPSGHNQPVSYSRPCLESSKPISVGNEAHHLAKLPQETGRRCGRLVAYLPRLVIGSPHGDAKIETGVNPCLEGEVSGEVQRAVKLVRLVWGATQSPQF